MGASFSRRLVTASRAALLLVWALGCATHSLAGGPGRFHYFQRPAADDPWTPKIAGWQSRERAQPAIEDLQAPAAVSDSGRWTPAEGTRGDLRGDYFEFRRQQRRQLAESLARWVQREARSHYVADGPLDHWATLEETLARNGDDCDGLELLVYHSLLDLGFPKDEVYRAIVRRPRDGQHHMVTFWFEQPDDPWVIDPTGAMTRGMPHMSEVPDWVPLKVFSETREFNAQPLAAAAR